MSTRTLQTKAPDRRRRSRVAPRRKLLIVVTAGAFVVAGCILSLVLRTSPSWRLVGEDNFSSALNPRWIVYDGASANPTQNRTKMDVTVRGGELQIRTVGQWGGGLCWCRDKPVQRYGRWDIRARMEAGQDHGPAILMWPTSQDWPADGELDLSEMPRADRSTSVFSIHYSAANRQIHEATFDDFTAWHTFSLEWEPDHISFSIDGKLRFTTVDEEQIPQTAMFLALQAGPDRANAADISATLHVDWVRVFSR